MIVPFVNNPRFLNDSKRIMKEFAENVFTSMMEHARVRYGLPENFHVSLFVSFGKNRVWHQGGYFRDTGQPFVDIALNRLLWMVPYGSRFRIETSEYDYLTKHKDFANI